MEEKSLARLMEERTAAKADMLRENGQTLKRDMLALIALIDAGEWEKFAVRHGEIVDTSAAVGVQVDAIRMEMKRRENILHHARLQLGGWKP